MKKTFRQMIEELEVLDYEPDTESSAGRIEEGMVSDNAIQMLMGAMLEAPRVLNMLKRVGLDPEDETVTASLSAALEPAVKLFLDSQGIKVSNMASAKKTIKGMASGKTEEDDDCPCKKKL